MAGLEFRAGTVAGAILLSLTATIAVVAALNPIAEGWARLFEWLAGPLGLPGGVGSRTTEVLGRFHVQTPYYLVEAGAPTPTQWRLLAAAAAALVALTALLPDRFTPLRYFLRFAAVITGISLAWFALAGAGRFPHTLPDHLAGLVGNGQAVLVVVPLLLGATFFAFDIGWARKLFLAILVPAHLAIFIPLQVSVHAWLAHHASLALLPPLFLLFGILAHVFVFVAFYGWGMSWPPPRRAE